MQINCEDFKVNRVITQATFATSTTSNTFCNQGAVATSSCTSNSKQPEEYFPGMTSLNKVSTQFKYMQKQKDNYKNAKEGVKKELKICIKSRNCNKQTCTTKSSKTTNLNYKNKEFPINNNDYKQTINNKSSKNSNSNNKFLNSIISISHCKHLKGRQRQQDKQLLQQKQKDHQRELNQTTHYQRAAKACPCQSHYLTPSSIASLQKSYSQSHKMTTFYPDLINLVYTLLLILSVTHLPLYVITTAEAGCRYEPSRSCEAICRPIWSSAYDDNDYQSTVLATNNVTLENFVAADYNCTIRALVLMPDDDSFVASLKRVVPILQVAEQHIRASGLLPSYLNFEWMPQDDKCDAAFAAVKAMDGIVKNCSHVLFGPVCDYSLAAVGRIAKYFNSHGTPLISVGGSTFDFEKPKTQCSDEFYMLLRTGMLSFESISELTISVMKRNKWSRSIFFYDADGQRNVAGQHTCYLMMTSLGKQMRNENMTFAQYRITEKLKNRTEEMTREIGNKNSELDNKFNSVTASNSIQLSSTEFFAACETVYDEIHSVICKLDK